MTQMGTQLSMKEGAFNPFYFAADSIDVITLRLVAAGVCMCLLANFFNWLRLFERTAFYILLAN